MVATDTNHGKSSQQLLVQNPALQWLWNSDLISNNQLMVCMTSSLAGYVLAQNPSMGNEFSLLPLSQPWPFQNVDLVPLLRHQLGLMGIHDTLAAVIATGRMVIQSSDEAI